MADFLSAQEALDLVMAHELNPNVAADRLLARVQKGDIPVKAAVCRVGDREQHNQFIPPERLRLPVWVKIDFIAGSMRMIASHVVQGEPPLWTGSATGVAFSRKHLISIWKEEVKPPQSAGATTVRKRGGGAPTKYDWAAAGGFMAGHVVENDYPSKTEALGILTEWFKKSGFEPDKRDLQKFLAAMYEFKKS